MKNKKTCSKEPNKVKREFEVKKILTEREMWNETEKRVRRKRKIAEWNFIYFIWDWNPKPKGKARVWERDSF